MTEIADWDRAIEFNPHDAGGYNNRGSAKAGLGRYAFAMAYIVRDIAKAGSGDKTAAEADFKQAPTLDPGLVFDTAIGLGQSRN